MSAETISIKVLGGREVGKISFCAQIGERKYISGAGHLDPSTMPPLLRTDIRFLQIREDLFGYFFSANYRHPFLEILLEGMSGFFLLVDSTHPGSIYEGQAILKYLSYFPPAPYIVVANKQDCEDAMTVGQIRRAMGLSNDTIILPCVATERASVAHVLNTLLAMVRPDLKDVSS